MREEEFKSTMEEVLEDAKTLLLRDGKIFPVAILNYENENHLIGLSFRDKRQKDEQLYLLKKFVKLKNADAVLVVTESWYVSTDGAKLTVEPSKHPMRKECIVIFGEYEGGNLTIMQIFGRRDEEIVFEKKIYMEEGISEKFNFGIKTRNKNENFINVRNLN